MNWHKRYSQQAQWTRELRAYVFNKINLNESSRVLEVGCGTGAILSGLPKSKLIHGLDIDPISLALCKEHIPFANLTRGNALYLPYADNAFDVVYCHFLLLWVDDPLQALLEMKRVTKQDGYIIAFAEPDYEHRIDQPDELIPLGKWQTAALRRQGADPSLGTRLAESFFQAGIKLIETGSIQSVMNDPSIEEQADEWAVIEADIQEMKKLDAVAWANKTRVLHVPTYFAWGTTLD